MPRGGEKFRTGTKENRGAGVDDFVGRKRPGDGPDWTPAMGDRGTRPFAGPCSCFNLSRSAQSWSILLCIRSSKASAGAVDMPVCLS
jgi:hypothetical protein